ncbi:MAG: alpha/beta hydrolase fold domain-containing protein, partial [Myxococcales bacterium]|nr:alpha/beta hydrolase fold domain-containing protein [Myxococcales bacterium]
LMDRSFPFGRAVDAHGWVIALPIGTPDDDGFLFWAAHERLDEDVDGPDVTYLRDVIAQLIARHAVDPARVYLLGHSNGGAMAQHMACKAADVIAGFVNVSGYNVAPARCAPSAAVSALHVHGTDDGQVPYDGRAGNPGVDDSAAWWAEQLGCDAAPTDAAEAVDLDLVPGPETWVRRWSGCADGRVAARWRMEGVRHQVPASQAFVDAVLNALEPQ